MSAWRKWLEEGQKVSTALYIGLAGLAVAGVAGAALMLTDRRDTGVLHVRLPPSMERYLLPGGDAEKPESIVGDADIQPEVAAAAPAAEPPNEAALAPSGAQPTPPTATGRAAEPRLTLGKGEYLPLAFDISSPGSGTERVGDRIVTRKKVRFAGRELGSAPIQVDGTARLFIDRADLARVLSEADAPEPVRAAAASGGGLVSFAELRGDGIDLRYEPNSDTISLALR